MTNVIPLFGSEPEAPEGLKMLLALRRREDNQLFRTAMQARSYFSAASCSIAMNDYGGTPDAETIAEDIFTLSHAEHRCARTAERLVHALVLTIRNATEGEIYNFRLIDGQGAVFMGYGDGGSFTLKVASDYKETLPDGTESFGRIFSMEFAIDNGQAFLIGQSTEL